MATRRILQTTKNVARRWLGMARWALGILSRTKSNTGNWPRLLLVYDFATQPFSIGDILLFQEAGLVLCQQQSLNCIDFAAVFDPDKPVVNDPAFSHVDPESFLFHLSTILPAAQTNPLLGSLLLFNSREALESYVTNNAKRYLTWPSLCDYASGEYLFYRAIRELFLPHFKKYGPLPALRSRPAASKWAKRFLAQHAGNCVAVTIQLRRNPANPARDSVHDAWLDFFRSAIARHPAKFFVLCGASEIDPRLRKLENVVIVKDHHTSLEQDLALIDNAAAHMGASSGPGSMALFGRKPFCMFGFDTDSESVGGLLQEGQRLRYPFSSPFQVWIRDKETAELLHTEFERLWRGLHLSGESKV